MLRGLGEGILACPSWHHPVGDASRVWGWSLSFSGSPSPVREGWKVRLTDGLVLQVCVHCIGLKKELSPETLQNPTRATGWWRAGPSPESERECLPPGRLSSTTRLRRETERTERKRKQGVCALHLSCQVLG